MYIQKWLTYVTCLLLCEWGARYCFRNVTELINENNIVRINIDLDTQGQVQEWLGEETFTTNPF